MEPLATPEDLALRTGSTFDPANVNAALTDASATVRAQSSQIFTRMTTSDVLKVNVNGSIRLPQRPVHQVVSVEVEGLPIAFTWNGADRIVIDRCAGYALVTTDHGYDVIPDDIVAVTCNVAARALASPPEDAGIQSRSITNYSESFGAVGAAGPAGLFNDEREILKRYRRPGTSAKLAQR